MPRKAAAALSDGASSNRRGHEGVHLHVREGVILIALLLRGHEGVHLHVREGVLLVRRSTPLAGSLRAWRRAIPAAYELGCTQAPRRASSRSRRSRPSSRSDGPEEVVGPDDLDRVAEPLDTNGVVGPNDAARAVRPDYPRDVRVLRVRPDDVRNGHLNVHNGRTR